MHSGRDPSLDVLRGIAVAVMVLGNVAVDTMVVPSPDSPNYLESICGIAPPLFFIVSGMLVAHAASRPGRGLRRRLVRCAQLLAVAALLDVLVWRVYPFVSVDVLYMIGLSLPVAYLATTRLAPPARWAVGLLVIFAAPLLQDWLGYAVYPTEYQLSGELVTEIEMPGTGTVEVTPHGSVLYNWIFDGWFPLFPWLGFPVIGAAAVSLRWRGGERRRSGILLLVVGLAFVTAGQMVGWITPDFVLTPRIRWGGVFVPPRWGYLLASFGTTALLFCAVDRWPWPALLRPIELFGRHALVLYVVHLFFLFQLENIFTERIGVGPYLALYAVVFASLTGLAAALDTAQRRGWLAGKAATGARLGRRGAERSSLAAPEERPRSEGA